MSDMQIVNKELEVTAKMGALLHGALMSGHPATVAYIGLDNAPHLSHRGTLQRLNDRQLAFWARNPEGGIVKAIGEHSRLAVLYSDFSDLAHRVLLNFAGRASIETTEEVRRKVYDSSPEFERRADADRSGIAIIIDIDEINGLIDGEYIRMRCG